MGHGFKDEAEEARLITILGPISCGPHLPQLFHRRANVSTFHVDLPQSATSSELVARFPASV